VQLEVGRGVLVAEVAALSHVYAEVVPKPTAEATQVFGADVEADVAVVVELTVCDGTVYELQIALRDDSLARVRNLVLTDTHGEVSEIVEL